MRLWRRLPGVRGRRRHLPTGHIKTEAQRKSLKGKIIMKKKIIRAGLLSAVLVFGFLMSGCVTQQVAEPVATRGIEPTMPRNFIVLGVVEFQQNQRREISYADVLNHARTLFPTANAVLDLRIEGVSRQVGGAFNRNVFVATGIAIQYVQTQGSE
jgi:hypothetical protein